MKKEEKKNCTAIVLSAGQGKRMGTSVQKQYIELQGKPIIYYTLAVFQKSEIIDDIILVVGKDQLKYVQEEIVRKYHFTKVKTDTSLFTMAQGLLWMKRCWNVLMIL